MLKSPRAVPAGMEDAVTLYACLGVVHTASVEELRSAFKRCALLVHPDKGGSKEAFQKVMCAFETLSDSARRARYDRKLQGGSETPGAHAGCQRMHTCTGLQAESQNCPSELPAKRKRESRGNGRTDKPSPKVAVTKANQSNDSVAEPCVADPNERTTSTETCSHADSSRQRHFLEQLSRLLPLLPASRRREVIQQQMSQSQRLELENFLRSHPLHRASQASVQADAQTQVNSLANTENESDGAETMVSSSSDEHYPLLCLENQPSSGSDNDVEVGRCRLLDEATRQQDHSSMEQQSPTDPGSEPESNIGSLASQENMPQGRGASSVKGISSFRSGSSCRYRSNCSVCRGQLSLLMYGRYVFDLSVALDHLMVLTTAKSFIEQGSISKTDESHIRDGIAKALLEHHTSQEEIGLCFSVQVSFAYWIGRSPLCTPLVHNMDVALRMSSRLAAYRGWKYSRGQCSIANAGFSDLQRAWSEFQKVYLDVCEEAGQCRERVATRLCGREEAHLPFREAKIERWNCFRMASSERQQRWATKEERRREASSRRAMSREDRLGKRRSHLEARSYKEVLERVSALLKAWSRYKARNERAAARAATVAARMEAARQRCVRQSRWRSMNRPDLTMADILDRRWDDPSLP